MLTNGICTSCNKSGTVLDWGEETLQPMYAEGIDTRGVFCSLKCFLKASPKPFELHHVLSSLTFYEMQSFLDEPGVLQLDITTARFCFFMLALCKSASEDSLALWELDSVSRNTIRDHATVLGNVFHVTTTNGLLTRLPLIESYARDTLHKLFHHN